MSPRASAKTDWVEKLVSTQVAFIRDTSQAFFSAMKDRLK
jgi:hypothetical protein